MTHPAKLGCVRMASACTGRWPASPMNSSNAYGDELLRVAEDAIEAHPWRHHGIPRISTLAAGHRHSRPR